jgi:hypothetical protein
MLFLVLLGMYLSMIQIYFLNFQKRENNRLHDEVKSISRDKDHIQSTIAKMHKKEEKVKHELESNTLRMKEAEGE